VHFRCQEREKKEKTQTIYHQRQSIHYFSTHAIPYGRGHDCASNEMTYRLLGSTWLSHPDEGLTDLSAQVWHGPKRFGSGKPCQTQGALV
jgi:hypothetical protein